MSLTSKIRTYLSQPYPFYYEGRTFLLLLGLLFVMAFAFNVLFEPFHVYFPEHRMSYFMISVVHAAVASLAFCSYYLLLRLFSVVPAQWTIGKELAGLAGFLLLAGLGQFLIRDLIYDNPNNWSWHYLLEEVRNTFLVGILFIALLVPVNFNRLFQRNQRMAKQLLLLNEKQTQEIQLPIRTQLKSDDFELNVRNFLFARSDGNYVTLYLLKGESQVKLLKRISLGDLEKQLSGIPNILRTHRSYLVNLSQIREISGNAQGFRLKLHGMDEEITVSRSMIPEFEHRMQRI